MAKAEVVSTEQWAEDFGLTQANCRYATAIAQRVNGLKPINRGVAAREQPVPHALFATSRS